MMWIAEEDGLCLYFELTDEQLDRVKQDRDYHKDELFISECHASVGLNCHIFTLIHNGNTKRILKYLRQLKNKYKTVSWWDKEKEKFLCQ